LNAGKGDMPAVLAPDEAGNVPQVITSPGAQVSLIRFNLEMPPYNNKAFRHALMYAIDCGSINKNLLAGKSVDAQCQRVLKGEFGFNNSLQVLPYDPEEAKELLKQIDLPKDLVVKLVTSTGGYQMKDTEVGQAIAANWEAIGLKTKVDYRSTDAWLDDALGGGNKTSADIPLMTYIAFGHFGNYPSRMTNRVLNRTSLVSTLGTKHPEIDPLLKTAQTSFDTAVADQAFQDLSKANCDDMLLLRLKQSPGMWGAGKAVRYEPGPGNITNIPLANVALHN
jgi:peptide/nickel transport system substrate-binding protein